MDTHSRVGGSGAASPDSWARAAGPETGAVIAGAGRGARAGYFHLVDSCDHVAREGLTMGGKEAKSAHFGKCSIS